MGVVFEIPAVIFLLSRLGIVSGPFLLRNMKYAVLGCFVVAAIITPTGDIGNMMILAVPMLGLYSIGILVAFIFARKPRV
jgi:sec-independent protein translocase protein TatC